MSDIILHPRLGVNPRMTTCFICGEAADIVLLGIKNYHETCADCGARVYGGVSPRNPCPKCGGRSGHSRTELDDYERQLPIPSGPCGDCREKLKDRIALMQATGGEGAPKRTGPVYFMREEDFKQVFNCPVPEKRISYLDVEAWEALGLPSVEKIKEMKSE